MEPTNLFSLESNNKTKRLGQYPTPLWVAEALVDRYFGDLNSGDQVIEPSCGPGRFLQAIPTSIPAIGVEMDPEIAEQARQRTGRTVITGDFLTVPLSLEPTVIMGNPPFNLKTIGGFLERSRALLPEGGRLGFILPAYMFQTASRVAQYAEQWSIRQEMIPRNIYPGLRLPLVFAVFSKDRRRTLVGFALYQEAAEVQGLERRYRDLLDEGDEQLASGSAWKAVVDQALRALGGEADLQSIYEVVEGRRPTRTAFWKEQIRKVLRTHYDRVGPARYALAA